jgi:hypothetical protein
MIPVLIRPLTIDGCDTGYHISDKGDVFNRNGNMMKPRYTPNGYMQACLRIDKRYKYIYVHRAVYEAFNGIIPDGLEINHIDGNKLNNHVNNLEWVTPKENIIHAHRIGLCPRPTGTKNGMNKYPEELIREVCKLLEKGDVK